MTLVIAVAHERSIWLAADRQLSSNAGHEVFDKAVKALAYEIGGDCTLMGYCGIGRTAAQVEISDWLVRSLRSQQLTIEQAIERAASVMASRLPPILAQLSPLNSSHVVVAPALVAGRCRLYWAAITLNSESGTIQTECHYLPSRLHTRDLHGATIAFIGSGSAALKNNALFVDTTKRLVKAYGQGKISGATFAKHLVSGIQKIHLADHRYGVGSKSFVISRNAKTCVHKDGGGVWRFNGADEDSSPGDRFIPVVAGGMDVAQLLSVIMPDAQRFLLESRTNPDAAPMRGAEETNEILRNMDWSPDDSLDPH